MPSRGPKPSAAIERRLLELRAGLLDSLQNLRESLPSPPPEVMDAEDTSVEDAVRDMEAALVELSGDTLRGIEEARQRLHAGTYGFCLLCGRRIPERRLRAVPFTRHCRACQEEAERDVLVPPGASNSFRVAAATAVRPGAAGAFGSWTPAGDPGLIE